MVGKNRTHEEFLIKLERDNPIIFNQLEFIEEYVNTRTKIQAQYKYGVLKAVPDSYYRLKEITVASAVDRGEFFRLQAQEQHKGKYKYPKNIIKPKDTNMNIICTTHGIVSVNIYKHIQGANCPKCVRELQKRLRFTHEEFLTKVKRENPIIFNQLEFIEKYKGSNVPIKAKHKYGNVWVQPDRLYSMLKITSDSAVDKTEFLVNQAREVHGELYGYHLVSIKAYQHTVQIVCSIHGIVPIDIYSHIQGAICSKCVIKAGFSRTSYINKLNGRTGTCYIIYCWEDKEDFYKIGISVGIKKRFDSKTKMPYEYKILHEFKGSAGYVYDLEKKLQKLHREQGLKYKPKLPFNGDGECFSSLLWEEINKENSNE